MKPLTVITWIVLIFLELKVRDSAGNGTTTLFIPPSKYACVPGAESSYCGLSASEMASLSCAATAGSTSSPPSSSCCPVTVSVVKAIATSPRILTSLSTASVRDFLDGLSGAPAVLQSVPPPDVARLIDILCASSPCLLQAVPARTLAAFVTAVVACPGLVALLPGPTTVRLIGKLDAETPAVLCHLSPAVRTALLRSALDPTALDALRPTEIVFLFDYLTRSEHALAELPPADVIALLAVVTRRPVLLGNLSTDQVVAFLLRASSTAPFALAAVPANVTDALLATVCAPSDDAGAPRRSAATLVGLTTVLVSWPHAVTATDPAIVSGLLAALSSPRVLGTVPPTLLVELLTEISLSAKLLTDVGAEVVVGLLYAVKCVAPDALTAIPLTVRSAYVSHLTDKGVIDALSAESTAKLIDTLINGDLSSFLTGLPCDSVQRVITLTSSTDEILNSVPPRKIVRFVRDLVTVMPFVLRETPVTNITKLLSPLTTITALSSLDASCHAQLVSAIADSPYLLNAIPAEQLANVLATACSSRGVPTAIDDQVYVDLLTQIFVSPALLSKIQLAVLVESLVKIEKCSPSVLCSVPSFAFSAFVDFLECESATKFNSLSPLDMSRLLSLLTKTPRFLSQISAKVLGSLLKAIASSSAALYNTPVETKIDFFYSTYSLLPSMFYSLPRDVFHAIVLSFDSFETLSCLSSDRLIKLITVVTEFPLLWSESDPKIVANLLNVLSASPSSTLCVLKPDALVNFMTSITSIDVLYAPIVPPSCSIRFLNALSVAAPSTLSCVPASVLAILLKPLESISEFNELTLADVECLIDVLIETPCLLIELPQPLVINLMTVISKTFTTLPHMKIIVLLASIHSASPSLMCLVEGQVLANLFDTFVTSADLSVMPPKFVEALVAVLSSSPCLMEAMPAAAFDCFLGLLTTSPKTLTLIPAELLAQFFTKLSMTPSALKNAKLSLIVSLLSSESATCAIPPIVISTLLKSLTDVKTVYDLEPADVASLICAATSNRRILDAIIGAPLDTLLAKVASSQRLLSFVSPSVIVSFFGALTSSPTALCSVQPVTLVNLLTTVAISQPTALSTLPPRVATKLLKVFDSQRVLASLPPPVVNSLLCLLLAFPNLLAALPLSTLDALLRLLTSCPAVLTALPVCTLARLLTALSTLPPLLRVLPAGLLASFLSAVSTAAPEFLCTLPPAVVTSLFGAVICEPALALSTPETVACLISTLNRSPCVILVLPGSTLISFLTYLTSHPCLLKNTSKKDLLGLVNKVKSPDTIPRVTSNCLPPCSLDCCGDFAAFQSFCSPTLRAGTYDVNKNDRLDLLETSLPKGPTCKMINAIPEINFEEKPCAYDAELPIPKLVMPENVEKATVIGLTKIAAPVPFVVETTSTR